MSYTINNNNSRNLRIQNRISDAAAKDDSSHEITALTELLKIDTSLDTTDFLSKFRDLKTQYPFINDLCQRKGFFGSIGYFFRGDDYRAGRYKIIVEQLKVGSYNDVSYFQNAKVFKESVCEKVEEIKNEYLKKAYLSIEEGDYKRNNDVFNQLKIFNKNLDFKPSRHIPHCFDEKDNINRCIWNDFVKFNPEYLSLNSKNENTQFVNINGKSMVNLKKEALKVLGLSEKKDINLFDDNNALNGDVGEAVEKQHTASIEKQHLAATKIRRQVLDFQELLKNKKPNKYKVREMVYHKLGTKKETFVFSENFVGHTLPNNNLTDGAEGAFKTMVGKDKDNVLFTQQYDPKVVISHDEAEKILLSLDIRSFKGMTQISSDQYIAHNAGANDLSKNIQQNKRFRPTYFKEVLADMKKLHENGYYHFDLKPENIQISDRGPTVIDLDMLSSTTMIYNGGTKSFLHYQMLELQRSHMQQENKLEDKSLRRLFQIRDDFAFALTLLLAAGITLPTKSRMLRFGKLTHYNGNMPFTKEMKLFVASYIKTTDKQQTDRKRKAFIQLVTNPMLYYKSENTLHLADIMDPAFVEQRAQQSA